MGIAATVYAELLSRHKHGHPLWHPEPSSGLDGSIREIRLGDVGYLDDYGGFRSLFNITVDAEHELNAGGVPEGFTPLKFNPALRCRNEDALNPGELCSEGVERVDVEGSVGASVATYASISASYVFKCNTHRGAFLYLKDYATHEWIEPNLQFTEYMQRHHDSWYSFVVNPQMLGLHCSPDDIILVRGTMKTSAWTVGAFPGQTDHSHAISGGGSVASVGKAKFRVTAVHSESQACEKRSGPRRRISRSTEHPVLTPSQVDSNAMHIDAQDQLSPLQGNNNVKDQCVFLSYYKVRYRKPFPKKIEAKADSPSLDKDTDDRENTAVPRIDSDIDIELDTENISPVIPLDILLDYILEYSDANVAIASDADFELLYPDGPIPINLAAALREYKPRIFVDESQTGRLGLESLDTDHDANVRDQFCCDNIVNNGGTLQPSRELVASRPQSPYRQPTDTLNPSTSGSDVKCAGGESGSTSQQSKTDGMPVDSPGALFQIRKGCVFCETTNTQCDGNIPCRACIARGRGRTCKAEASGINRVHSDPSLEATKFQPLGTFASLKGKESIVDATDEDLSIVANPYNIKDKFLTPPGEFMSPDILPPHSLLSIASRFPSANCILSQKPFCLNPLPEETTKKPPIIFYSEKKTKCGIRCKDAFNSRLDVLDDGDVRMFEKDTASVIICLMWPGYPPWSREIPTRDLLNPSVSVTHAGLAKTVTRAINHFIEDMENYPMDEGADSRYKVGRAPSICLEDLDLIGLEHICLDNWQAHVRLRRSVGDILFHQENPSR